MSPFAGICNRFFFCDFLQRGHLRGVTRSDFYMSCSLFHFIYSLVSFDGFVGVEWDGSPGYIKARKHITTMAKATWRGV